VPYSRHAGSDFAVSGHGPLRLPVPESCKYCGAAGHVIVETIMLGRVVSLRWHCRSCEKQWPILVTQEYSGAERRVGAQDRRRRTRSDRRRRPKNE